MRMGRGGSKGKGKAPMVDAEVEGEGERLLKALEEKREGLKVVDGVMQDADILLCAEVLWQPHLGARRHRPASHCRKKSKCTSV